MKKIGFATVVASGLAGAILGLAAPAAAVPADAPPVSYSASETKMGIDHLNWLDDIRQKVKVPMVDTSVRQSR
jgi:hypothetical protein